MSASFVHCDIKMTGTLEGKCIRGALVVKHGLGNFRYVESGFVLFQRPGNGINCRTKR
jgi:hypothetical protein